MIEYWSVAVILRCVVQWHESIKSDRGKGKLKSRVKFVVPTCLALHAIVGSPYGRTEDIADLYCHDRVALLYLVMFRQVFSTNILGSVDHTRQVPHRLQLVLYGNIGEFVVTAASTQVTAIVRICWTFDVPAQCPLEASQQAA